MKTITLQFARIKFVLIILTVLSFKSYAQSGDYYSLQNGDVLDFNIWAYDSQTEGCGCVPDNDGSCGVTIPANKTVHIRHTLTTNCDLYIGANSILIVESSGSLSLNGTASMIGDGLLQIDVGGVVDIGGDLNLNGNATVTNNGFLTVGENLTFGGSSLFCGSGTLDVLGNIIGGAPCALMTILPIELTYFKGNVNQNTVELIWETASEINNDYFEIEKSSDGINYILMERTDSKAINGNSSSRLKYILIDESPFEDISYYRLKQIDLNKKFQYSNAIAINFSKKAFDVTFFPNPNKGELSIRYNNDTGNQDALFLLKNTMDKIVYSYNVDINSVNKTSAFKIPNDIPSGIYFCTLLVNDKSYTQKIILLPK